MSSLNKNLFFETREKFLKFFKERGHSVVSSSSLMPDDPSVLLTTAGMQQFKRYYTNELNPESDFGSRRTTSLQKCFRTSDIEEVGDDTHLTFFEMMGNFSFGPIGMDDSKDFGKNGYFKRSAITWAYEFITDVLEISPERIYVTVFEGDDENHIPKDTESYAIWKSEIGLDEKRIRLGSKKDNFWGPTGNEGPCGPTTEIYVAPSADEAIKGNGVEIWNIVFNEFYKTRTNTDSTQTNADEKKSFYKKVENPGIDTGMGYERLLATLEGVENVFETSAFSSIIDAINETAPGISQRELRILADHIRSASFLIADGIEPSNKEAGYILRRLLRRIIAIKIKNDIHSDIFQIGYEKVKIMFGDIYPEIKDEKKIIGIWQEERVKSEKSISNGISHIPVYQEVKNVVLTADSAFDLHQSYGLPIDITKEYYKYYEDDIDNKFRKKVEEHQEISRAGQEKKFGGHGLVLDTGELKATNEEDLNKVIRMHTATHLLQWALRKNIDKNIRQTGSDINPERMRFDFNFDRKLTVDEISLIERDVNDIISKDLPVYYKEMPKDEAISQGALSFFRQKYPDIVKVYYVGSDESGGIISSEFCGGPHVSHTLEIGKFVITKEESVAKGVRRIRAKVE